jgi:methyl-accepting chemotaxis protein
MATASCGFPKVPKNHLGTAPAFHPFIKKLRSSKNSKIERQILAYLSANPDAQDTLRGIAEWWLLKQRIMEAIRDVEAAVSNLVANGKLSARTGLDGQVRYHLAR